MGIDYDSASGGLTDSMGRVEVVRICSDSRGLW